MGRLLSGRSIKHLENLTRSRNTLTAYERRLAELKSRSRPNERLIKQQEELVNKAKNEEKANSEVLNSVKAGSGSASKTVSNTVQDEVKDRKKTSKNEN